MTNHSTPLQPIAGTGQVCVQQGPHLCLMSLTASDRQELDRQVEELERRRKSGELDLMKYWHAQDDADIAELRSAFL